MKMYQIYVCEKCGKTSTSQEEIEQCEATHMGLTVSEMHTYQSLESAVKYFSAVLYRTNNAKAREAYDDAIEKLLSFEKEHGLTSK